MGAEASPLPRRIGRIILASVFLIGGGMLWVDGLIIFEFRDLCSDAIQGSQPCINQEYWLGLTMCVFAALVMLLSFCTMLCEYWEVKKIYRDGCCAACSLMLIITLLISVSYHR